MPMVRCSQEFHEWVTQKAWETRNPHSIVLDRIMVKLNEIEERESEDVKRKRKGRKQGEGQDDKRIQSRASKRTGKSVSKPGKTSGDSGEGSEEQKWAFGVKGLVFDEQEKQKRIEQLRRSEG